MDDRLNHALGIGTLGLWLGVTVLAMAAMGVSPRPRVAVEAKGTGGGTRESTLFVGVEAPDDEAGEEIPPDAQADSVEEKAEPLPSPPALVRRAAAAPLPPLPDPPPPVGRPRDATSLAARLASGRTPGPVYPAAARQAGQSGTVVVQFTVDAAGRVADVAIYASSRWNLLDEEALRTVRQWKFPPGEVMTLIRPIVFELP